MVILLQTAILNFDECVVMLSMNVNSCFDECEILWNGHMTYLSMLYLERARGLNQLSKLSS